MRTRRDGKGTLGSDTPIHSSTTHPFICLQMDSNRAERSARGSSPRKIAPEGGTVGFLFRGATKLGKWDCKRRFTEENVPFHLAPMRIIEQLLIEMDKWQKADTFRISVGLNPHFHKIFPWYFQAKITDKRWIKSLIYLDKCKTNYRLYTFFCLIIQTNSICWMN